MENNEKVMNKFLESLEAYCISLTDRLDELDKLENDYNNVLNMINSLNDSKIEYAKKFFSLSLDDKDKFRNTLSRIIKNDYLIDDFIEEIVNLYYLDNSGLINLDSVMEQKNYSFEVINRLVHELNKFILSMDIDSKTREKTEIRNRVSDVSELGNLIEDAINPIDDIKFIEDIFNVIDLTDEEKEIIIINIFERNMSIYHRNLEEKDREVSKKIEDNVKEVEETLSLEEDLVPRITDNVVKEIRDLLRHKEILKKIITIVNQENEVEIDDYGRGITSLDQVQIDESVSIVEEEIINRLLKDSSLTVEDALKSFLEEYDDIKETNFQTLNEMFDGCFESTKEETEQDKIIIEGFNLYNKNRKLVRNLTIEDRNRIYDYMFSIYREIVNRLEIYKSISYTSDKQLLSEAVYEISILKRLYEDLDSDKIDIIKPRISRRIEEILGTLKQVMNNKEEITVEGDTEKSSGNLFLLMHGNISFLEEDLNIENNKVNYSEVIDTLSSIQNRSTNRFLSTSGNYMLKELKKYGVLFNTKGKVKIFYIPIGRGDALIVGEEIADNEHYEKIESRVKKNSKKIEKIISELSDEEKYDELVIDSIDKLRLFYKKISNKVVSDERKQKVEDVSDEMLEEFLFADQVEDSSDNNNVK